MERKKSDGYSCDKSRDLTKRCQKEEFPLPNDYKTLKDCQRECFTDEEKQALEKIRLGLKKDSLIDYIQPSIINIEKNIREIPLLSYSEIDTQSPFEIPIESLTSSIFCSDKEDSFRSSSSTQILPKNETEKIEYFSGKIFKGDEIRVMYMAQNIKSNRDKNKKDEFLLKLCQEFNTIYGEDLIIDTQKIQEDMKKKEEKEEEFEYIEEVREVSEKYPYSEIGNMAWFRDKDGLYRMVNEEKIYSVEFIDYMEKSQYNFPERILYNNLLPCIKNPKNLNLCIDVLNNEEVFNFSYNDIEIISPQFLKEIMNIFKVHIKRIDGYIHPITYNVWKNALYNKNLFDEDIKNALIKNKSFQTFIASVIFFIEKNPTILNEYSFISHDDKSIKTETRHIKRPKTKSQKQKIIRDIDMQKILYELNRMIKEEKKFLIKRISLLMVSSAHAASLLFKKNNDIIEIYTYDPTYEKNFKGFYSLILEDFAYLEKKINHKIKLINLTRIYGLQNYEIVDLEESLMFEMTTEEFKNQLQNTEKRIFNLMTTKYQSVYDKVVDEKLKSEITVILI